MLKSRVYIFMKWRNNCWCAAHSVGFIFCKFGRFSKFSSAMVYSFLSSNQCFFFKSWLCNIKKTLFMRSHERKESYPKEKGQSYRQIVGLPSKEITQKFNSCWVKNSRNYFMPQKSKVFTCFCPCDSILMISMSLKI